MKNLKFLFLSLCVLSIFSCKISKNTDDDWRKGRHANIVMPEKLKIPKVEENYLRVVAPKAYYIDAAVSSGGSGTFASPWPFSKYTSTSFQAGDTILLKRGGIYTAGQMVLNFSGVLTDAYGTGNKPKIIVSQTLDYLFYSQTNNNTFRNLWITDPGISSTDRSINARIRRAFTFEGTGNKIISCDISLVGVAGYFVGANNTMDSCDVGNLRMVVNTDDGGQPGRDDDYGANPLVISSGHNTITHNYFHDCWAASYDYTYDGGAIELYNRSDAMDGNTITGNTFSDCLGLSEVTGNAANTLYSFNKIINNGSLFYFQSGYNYTNWQFINNAIVENVASRVPESRLIGGAPRTITLTSNVFQMSNGIDVASNATGLTHTNNIYTMSNNSTINYSLGTNEYELPSVFAITVGNPTTWNYTLKAGTPNIGYTSLSSTTPSSTCVPIEQTRQTACPVGQTGIITEHRTMSCPDSTWSAWTTVTNTCASPPPPTILKVTIDASYIYLKSALKAGTYRLYTGTTIVYTNIIKSGTYTAGNSQISVSRFGPGTYTFRTNQRNYVLIKP